MCNNGTRSVSYEVNRAGYAQTFEHRVADIVMGADITSRIGNCAKESIRGGETGRDTEKIRGGRAETTNRIFIVHEELEDRQERKTEDEFRGTYFKQGREIVALSIAVHVRLGESEVAH